MANVGKVTLKSEDGVALIDETLTDNSHVYNIELLGRVSIPCVDYKRVHHLWYLIHDQGQPLEIYPPDLRG